MLQVFSNRNVSFTASQTSVGPPEVIVKRQKNLEHKTDFNSAITIILYNSYFAQKWFKIICKKLQLQLLVHAPVGTKRAFVQLLWKQTQTVRMREQRVKCVFMCVHVHGACCVVRTELFSSFINWGLSQSLLISAFLPELRTCKALLTSSSFTLLPSLPSRTCYPPPLAFHSLFSLLRPSFPLASLHLLSVMVPFGGNLVPLSFCLAIPVLLCHHRSTRESGISLQYIY